MWEIIPSTENPNNNGPFLKTAVRKILFESNPEIDEKISTFIADAIISLPKELMKCSTQLEVPLETQLANHVNQFLTPWVKLLDLNLSLNDDNNSIQKFCQLLLSEVNEFLLLLAVPNKLCASFDEHPVEMNESNTLIPTTKDLLPSLPTQSSKTERQSDNLNTCATIEQKATVSQKVKRAEKKKFSSTTAPAIADEVISAPLDEEMFSSTKTRDITIENFDLDMKGRPIITNGTLTIPFGRRIGLIGRNGVGKSTLLRALAHRKLPVAKYIKICHVEQEVIGDDTPAIDSLVKSDQILQLLQQREVHLQSILNATSSSEAERGAAYAELAKVHTRLVEIDADSAVARASMILSGLGFQSELHKEPTRSFSGGWRMRLALAKALFCKPDLLLLDEPTNMLDLPSVAWLSLFLRDSWSSSLLVVSHDRDFLDRIVTDILYLHHNTLDFYRMATYSSFLRLKEERRLHHERERAANIVYRQSLQTFIDRWRYQASRAALAQSKIKILEKLPIIPPWPVDPPVQFQFAQLMERLPEPWLSITNLSFHYGGDKPSFRLFCNSFSIHAGSRIALLGANGSGKSTFLKILTGDLQPLPGSHISRQARLRIAYFAQHHVDALDMKSTSIDALARCFSGVDIGKTSELEEVRRHLGAFGLSGSLALQPIETLSGGQKSRVVFAGLALQRPHVMILDEPTNHLDMDAIEALVVAMKSFSGAIIVVSHDVRFLEQTCTEMYLCEKNTISRFPGDTIIDYVRYLGLLS